MQKSAAPKSEKPKQPVALVRADFYEDRYYTLILIVLLAIGIFACLIFGFITEKSIEPEPVAFATTADGKLMAPTPLNVPGFTNAYIIEWAVQAINKSFAFNFINYESVFTNATTYYTKLGFQDYRTILVDSGIVNTVLNQKYSVQVEPISAPIILKEAVTPDNVFSWQVQFGIRVTFENVKQTLKQDWIVTMLMVRVPISDSPEGLGIAALIAREGKTGVT